MVSIVFTDDSLKIAVDQRVEVLSEVLETRLPHAKHTSILSEGSPADSLAGING
jgi:hypothetical protein